MGDDIIYINIYVYGGIVPRRSCWGWGQRERESGSCGSIIGCNGLIRDRSGSEVYEPLQLGMHNSLCLSITAEKERESEQARECWGR